MDKLERRLKEDAKGMNVQVSPDLQSRIEATVHGLTRPQAAEPRSTTTLWWASSLTGLLAAMLIIVLLNWNRETAETQPVRQARELPTVPQLVIPVYGRLALTTRTADLTSPLEEELLHLRADIEKARENLERDIRNTF